jgi:hypothetical protein
MPLAIKNSVDIELFIEGRRLPLFEKITQGNVATNLLKTMGYVPVESISSIYSVIGSFWDEPESKRVFKVQHLSSHYLYYAFMLDDYIVCPAFLARSLKITNYACLNVIHGNNYPYIFVKAEAGDSKVYFGADQLDLRGEHTFELPVEQQQRVLNLTSQDALFQVFINFEERSSELGLEWGDVTGNLNNAPEESKLYPHYFYIPSETFGEFEKDHEAFLRSKLYFGNNALIYRESKSFSEMYLWLSKDYAKKDLENQNAVLGEIFDDTPYLREDYVLNKLVNHIERNYKKSKASNLKGYYCSMIAVLQSSGYGKSKLMERLGSITPTFYSSLQHGKGYPEESFFLARLIKQLDTIITKNNNCFMSNVSTAVYIYILRIIYIILSNTEDPTLVENFQIDNIVKCKEFSSVPISDFRREERIFGILFDKGLVDLCESKVAIVFNGAKAEKLSKFLDMHPQLIRFATDFEVVNDLEETVMVKLERMGKDNLPSIFVIDEAKGLHYKRPEEAEKNYSWIFQDYDPGKRNHQKVYNRAPCNVFRRIFRMFISTWVRLMLIVIGTSGQISLLLPELEFDPSRRKSSSNKFIENFALVQTYNVNSELAKSIQANYCSDWNVFLKSDQRKEEFFKLGRPLIYAHFKMIFKEFPKNYDIEAHYRACDEFTFYGEKLFGGAVKFQETSNDSLLYSMFNFAFGTNLLPSHMRMEDLIENYLMTLIGYLDENGARHLIANFLPEGVFNFLSAKYFTEYPKSLMNIFQLSSRYGLCNVGQFGELLAQYVLFRTAFVCIDPNFIKVRKLVFESISLKKFLLVLTDNDKMTVERFFELNPELVDSKISFSYFEHFPNKPIKNPYDLMARCVLKGSAVTLNNFFRGIDLMIPLILKDGMLSFLGIQVKFVKLEGVKESIRKATEKMTFSNMFKEGPECRPFGLLILALGDYQLERERKLEVSLSRETGRSKEAPTILVIKGKPKPLQDPPLNTIFDLAPKYSTYRGICSEHLMACDHLYGLIQELPFSKEAIKALKNYVPKDYDQTLIIESNNDSEISEGNESPMPGITFEAASSVSGTSSESSFLILGTSSESIGEEKRK